MTGQGALSLAATTLVARTITHKPGLALGIVGAVGSAGISLAPVGLERLIALTDIATAWRTEAALVAIIVLPIAFLLPQDLPRTTTETGTHIVIVPETGYTSGEALRTGMFWVLASAGFMVGMLSTGLAFHLISILGAQGLSTLEAAAFVRYYGRGHIGAIRGIATSIGLASTALGPLYFALGLAFSGSYLPVSILAAVFPLVVAFGAMFVKPPPAPVTLEA